MTKPQRITKQPQRMTEETTSVAIQHRIHPLKNKKATITHLIRQDYAIIQEKTRSLLQQLEHEKEVLSWIDKSYEMATKYECRSKYQQHLWHRKNTQMEKIEELKKSIRRFVGTWYGV